MKKKQTRRKYQNVRTVTLNVSIDAYQKVFDESERKNAPIGETASNIILVADLRELR